MAFLFALVSSVGDMLQITQGVPYSVVNILMSAILFSVLCGGRRVGAAR
jgi:simple sugar transport system permease protein